MKYNAIFLLMLLVLQSKLILSQDKEPVTVSPVIGEKLDRIEEEYFKLVPAFNNVQEAVFYLNPDSSLNVFVTYELNGVKKDTMLLNYISFSRLKDYIDYQLTQNIKLDQKIERGKYVNVLTKIDSVQGELLAVDSSSIIVLNLSRINYKRDYQPPFDVKYIYEKNIKAAMVYNEYNAAKFIYPTILGLGLGLTAGYIAKNNTEEVESDLSAGIYFDFTPLLYGMLGATAGYLIGLGLSELLPINVVSVSQYDYPIDEDDITGLRRASRYK